jgi:hypothetical protein
MPKNYAIGQVNSYVCHIGEIDGVFLCYLKKVGIKQIYKNFGEE